MELRFNNTNQDPNYQQQKDDDKYDPEDIYDDYKDDHDDDNRNDNEIIENHKDVDYRDQRAFHQLTQKQPEKQQDDYDSDSEFRLKTREKNSGNIKRKLDSNKKNNLYSSDSEDSSTPIFKIQCNKNNPFSKQSEPSLNKKMDTFEQYDLPSSAQKKKRSRWGDMVNVSASVSHTNRPPSLMSLSIPRQSTSFGNQNKPMLTTVTRNDTAFLQYARANYGTINLSEEDWQKCEDHYKVNLLYQDMLKKRNEINRLANAGRFKYEYDSDEDVAGGTWEHKLRTAEMEATTIWTEALNKQAEGKHHIGDFLPPEELKKFMEKYSQQGDRKPDLSDYKEYKLKEDNKGSCFL